MSAKYFPELVISGVGMASSMGGVVMACACARAGINNFKSLGIKVPDPGEAEPYEITGAVNEFVVGYEDYGRLIYLLAPALKEALSFAKEETIDYNTTEVIIVLPDPVNRPSLIEIEDYDQEFPKGIKEFFIERLISISGLELKPELVTIIEEGHAGVFRGIYNAMDNLLSDKIERCIFCGVDSYMNEMDLYWSLSSNRIKSAMVPAGFIPGEGAGAVILESRAAATARNSDVLASVGPVSFKSNESPNEEDEETSVYNFFGNTLKDVLIDVISKNPDKLSKIKNLISDINGEPVRSDYFHGNLLKVSHDYKGISEMNHSFIAESFGDIGCATGVFQICYGVRAFQRHYSECRDILMCSTSDNGSSGALIISRNEF